MVLFLLTFTCIYKCIRCTRDSFFRANHPQHLICLCKDNNHWTILWLLCLLIFLLFQGCSIFLRLKLGICFISQFFVSIHLQFNIFLRINLWYWLLSMKKASSFIYLISFDSLLVKFFANKSENLLYSKNVVLGKC